MHPLGLPQRFPEPQSMKNCSTSTWIAWIREENNDLIAAIDEENAQRRDPDDPFDGTAGGIFAPLQHEDEHEVHQPQNTSGFQRCDTGPQIDESENLIIQNKNAQDSRLVDILNTNPQHQDVPERMTIPKTIQGAASQPQRPSNKQQLCRGITRIHRLPSRPSHPYGRQPHSLIFMSTLYKATSCLPASS